MGKILMIKDADFSKYAVDTTIVDTDWLFGVRYMTPAVSFLNTMNMYFSEQASELLYGKTVSTVFLRIGNGTQKNGSTDESAFGGETELTIGVCEWGSEITTQEILTTVTVQDNVVTSFEPITFPSNKRPFVRSSIGENGLGFCAQYTKEFVTVSGAHLNTATVTAMDIYLLIDFK